MEDRLMDENTEEYLEILYWEFDSDKKKFSFTERDLFKAKMRKLIRTIQNTRASDPPLEKLVESLEELDDMFDPTSKVGEIINKALQEYREMKDAK